VRRNVAEIIYRATFICVLTALLCITQAKAADGPCDPFNPQPGCEDFNPDDVPIDGGASILIAAGVAYGLKKAYDKRNNLIKEKADQ
jgi:hypothetical protein